jgi:putative transposase
MSVTISKNCSNQYFVSITVDHEINKFNKTNKEVGIDVGLKEFLVQSDNLIVKNPKYFSNNQANLKKVQQRFSKKLKGSKRRNKFRLKISRLHQKISNQRDWFLHNESTRIVRDYDVICIEDLCIQGIVINHKLAKSIYDVSWSKFFQLLEYKSNWYGKEIIKINRFEPSSKTCSCCGWINDNQTLADRIFNCPICGLEIDRDLNASINIRKEGIKIKQKALGVDNAIRTLRNEVTSFCEAFKS